MTTSGLDPFLTRCRAVTGGEYRLRSSGNVTGPCPVCQPGLPKGDHLSVKPGGTGKILVVCHHG